MSEVVGLLGNVYSSLKLKAHHFIVLVFQGETATALSNRFTEARFFYRSTLRSLLGCSLSAADIAGDGVRMKIVKEIAKGGFSQVLMCKDIDSQDLYAVKKIICNSKEEERRICDEADVHRKLADVQNVVQLIALINHQNEFYLVFPYYQQGTVHDELVKRKLTKKWLPEHTVLRYTIQLCSAVAKLHGLNMAHRDLKTANILLDEAGNALLTDFGSCASVPKQIESSRDHQQYLDEAAEYCSMPYRAPELFTCDIGTTITEKIDIWSIGCCIYAFCYFSSPFDAIYEQGNSIALAAQSPEKIQHPPGAPFSDEIKTLMRDALVVNPEDRPNLDEILERCQLLFETEKPPVNDDLVTV